MGSIPHREPEATSPLIHRPRSLPKHVLSFCWESVLALPSHYFTYFIRRIGLEAAYGVLCSALGIHSIARPDRRVQGDYPSRELGQGHQDPRLSVVHGLRHPPISQSICDFLDVHASVSPTSIAVQDVQGGQLTYDTLRAHSVRLARCLQEFGVRRGSRVCLVVERSSAFLVALFAVLRVGAAYIPLDGANIPPGVLKDVVDDAQPTVILVSKAHTSRHGRGEGSWYCIEDLLCAKEDEDVGFQFGNDYARPEDPAYIIFTSGTTGRPKGVMVSHSNVVNLVCQAPGNLGIRPGTKVAQLLNVAFDMCAWEVFSCILNGGSLYLRGPRRRDWIKVMKTVDVLICTPSILEPHDAEEYPNLKVIATAGEPCTKELLERWSNKVDFYNSCGPTEVTIVNTMDLHRSGADVTIGYPTPNNSVYVLDSELRPVPRGEIGVMWAGGAGISLGYLNLPELTKTRGMMYNTGDLGRLRADGKFDHRGRVDDQVKFKGFRVELDGVSAAMHSCPGITSACALLIDGELHGFYAPDLVPATAVLKKTMALQPRYAVPTRYLALSVLPLTANGKVDKRKLRDIGEDPNTQFEMPSG
ncbi:transporter [Ganoderma sinense ZZ0214-1]|uniref:Transporter n=1 Tax=Ganoderma sinense ZZ0214-1 TaxID=1077348 RepID=A0A2G8RWT7_9APHY|nr:transporter [Ganoderma sinense ZZ0214-1]